MDEKLQEYKEYRSYIEEKYGRDYQSAIVKLSIKEPYDKRGLLKPQYALTEQEKNALMFYIPEVKKTSSESLSTKDKMLRTLKNTDKTMKDLVIQIAKTQDPKKADLIELLSAYELSLICQNYLSSKGIKVIAYEHVNINDVIGILTTHGLLEQKEDKKSQGRR